MSYGKTLRELLAQPGMVIAPGAYDGLTAKLVRKAGFKAAYMSGGGVSCAAGVPDVNFLNQNEVIAKAREVVRAGELPIIVDADTGFGGLVNIKRTVRELEDAGIAALHLEDQPFPKRCGYGEHGKLVSIQEMCERIDVAVNERRDPDLLIIARTESDFASSFDEAIERANAYTKAGADVLFVCGMRTREQAMRATKEAPGLHLFNYSGSGLAPKFTRDELVQLGYKICIYTIQGQRLMAKAYLDMLQDLNAGGSVDPWADKMITWEQWQEISGVPGFNEFERRYMQAAAE